MRIIFITDNFTPEVNAPATRTYEHCKEWVKKGADVGRDKLDEKTGYGAKKVNMEKIINKYVKDTAKSSDKPTPVKKNKTEYNILIGKVMYDNKFKKLADAHAYIKEHNLYKKK